MSQVIVIVISVLLVASPTSLPPSQRPPDWADYCGGIETLARGIMERRQQNASMNEVMKLANHFSADPASEKLVRSIVIEAYERPAYSTDQYKQREVKDFANVWTAKCWQAQRAEK